MMRRSLKMARMKSMSSIEAEIEKINGALTALQKRQEKLTKRLLDLQKQKRDFEARQIMDAFQKSSKTLQELMKFLEV